MPLFLPCIRRAAPRDSKALPSSSRAQPHTVCSTLTQYGGLATFLCGKKSRHHFGDAANDRLGGPNRMRKLLAVCGTVLFLSLVSAIPSVAGPCSQDSEAPGIFIPDRSCFQLGFGYQYQNYSGIEGRSFHNNGYNIDASLHLFDAITGASGRLAASVEGTGAFGFGGQTSGTPPSLNAKSLFLGAGPRLSIESGSRFEPWVHGLVGLEHLKFTQIPTLGSTNGLGFMLGGGLDFKLQPRLVWRLQADYLGTDFQSSLQSNYSVGTGIIFRF